MTRLHTYTVRALAALVIFLIAVSVAGILVVRSGWFRERVRERIIAELERATGGRAELGSFAFDWTTLVATVSPLVLHGTEAATEPPLLRIESVTVGLRLISMLERKVDLASLRVEKPVLHVVFYADGSNNWPTPPRPGNQSWARNLVNLAVGRYEVSQGLAEFDLHKVPLNIRGEDLQLAMSYEAAGPRYRGELSSRRLRISSSATGPAQFDVEGNFILEPERVSFSRLRIASGRSRADLTGELTNLRLPHSKFSVRAQMAMADTVSLFSLPVSPVGTATFDGDLTTSFDGGFDFTLAGRASAQGVGYQYQRLLIENATVNAAIRATPGRVTLRGLTASALGATFTGQGDLAGLKNVHVEGTFEGLGVRQAANVFTDRAVAWNGVMAGDAVVDAVLGEPLTRLQATVIIARPASVTDGTPIEGRVEFGYDQRAGALRLGASHVATSATSVDVSGTLSASAGQTLDVRARSTNLDDVMPALLLLDPNAPTTLPLKLDGGEANVAGVISGTPDLPRFRGQIALTRPVVDGHAFTRISSDVDATRANIALQRLAIIRGGMSINGDVTLGGWTAVAPLTAHINVRNAAIAELAKEFGSGLAPEIANTPLSGTASATVRLVGTLQRPEGEATLDVVQAAALGEQAERVRGNVRYAGQTLQFTGMEVDLTPGKLRFSGSYTHPENNWRIGELRADVSVEALRASRLAMWRESQPARSAKLDARVDGKTSVAVHVERGAFVLRSLNGESTLRGVTMYGETLGDVTLAAETRGVELGLRSTAQIRGATVQGQGSWRLEGDMPGSGTVRLSRITIASLYDLVMLGSKEPKPAPPPFEGFFESNAKFTVSLRDPGAFQAEAVIDKIELSAKNAQALRLNVQAQDIVIHNTQPVLVSLSRNEARIRSASLTARDTNLELSGTIPFTTGGSADLAVKGAVNLAALQLLNPDLLARGNATVAATIRGSIRNPQMNGRLELTGASLYLNDVPNGMDNASGVILFDRNRATIERLSADTGGGTVSLGGFLEFGEPLLYRLRAEARQVRVRYPEDVSTTFNAELQLNGTSESSTLSGAVTLNRAAISAGADMGRVLAAGSQPSVSVDTPNDYLRGIRLDMHVESSPSFEFETSLTRNVQAEVDLRLRGTPERPVLSGDISVNSGEVQIFGNRYTVNRGDIQFVNPVRIEPTFDVNLETKARGIIVNVGLSGTPQRLNVSYSSDPPLQSREIIALLAVGRDPSAATRAAANQLNASASSFADAGGLLGEAVSQQLSNRLQRFFGASRVKIDPTMTGIDSLPQARLTLEQQVSRDITLTYITNLNRTQEQIVRMQWDLSPQWSAIAVRRANGLFGVDFQYRKRFK